MTRAPASTQSMIAASSSGDALGVCPSPDSVSPKMGRISSVQFGHIAAPLSSASQQALQRQTCRAHKRSFGSNTRARLFTWDLSNILAREIRMPTATGPSMSPMAISGLPSVTFNKCRELHQLQGLAALQLRHPRCAA